VDPTTLFIVALFLFVGCSVFVGELFSRIGQAALVGQLLVGIVFGPTLLSPLLGFSSLSSELTGLQFLATFFILLTAGLAITPEQIRATGAQSAVLGVSIFLIPFLAGTAVVRLLYPGLGVETDLFVALTISITALPVLGIMLREFGLMESRFGVTLLNCSLANELAAVTAFSILLRVSTSSSPPMTSIVYAGVTVALFLSTILAIHMALRSLRHLRVWEKMVRRARATWRSREAGFALVMICGLGAALYAQTLGLTFLVGAFYAGLLITPESAGPHEHRQLARVIDTITWGFFIPLFFALVGFGMDLRSLVASPSVALAFAALCVFAFFSKVFAGSAITRLFGWSPTESLGAGFLVASRGAVELAMAVILRSLGIFSLNLFTVVAGVGLVTTLLSPIGARSFVRDLGAKAPAPAGTQVRPWVSTSFPDLEPIPELLPDE
jgi:Kef-type K+ transport system membrane component KefB